MNKIMVLANNDVGLYKFRKELIEVLLQRYEVHICLPYGSYVDDLTRMGCIFHPTEFSRRGTNPISDLSLLRSYFSLLRRVTPVVVLSYTIKPNVYGGIACATLNIPYIANITGLGTAVENGGILQIITTVLYRCGLRKAAKVFFQNEDNLQFMRQREIVKRNYDLLPGSGVNIDQYKVIPYPEDAQIHFLFVARVMKQKGIDEYLDAAEYITSKYPNTRFHICGGCDGDYADVLAERVRKGHVIYHGAVKDMLPIYGMSSCTIHPTFYPEGMSNVLLESCACGRPIITTDRPGCREILEDGVNGFVCRAQDSQDLIHQIEKFLSLSYEERRDMGLQARRKVERDFDRNIVIQKYLTELSKHG